jgi:formylglycine-generating enzyme required for sulfatase activity
VPTRDKDGNLSPRAASRLAPGYLRRTGYRLPTETEWERACRAGTTTSRFFGGDEDLLVHYAHLVANSADRTARVGQYMPNPWGLFDVYGNVWEWCLDRSQVYPRGAGHPVKEDGEDVLEVDLNWDRILRGGAFNSPARYGRSAQRFRGRPTTHDVLIGFRVARTIPPNEP